MTFTEIVNDVMNRLNLTSTDARNRIETRINHRYRRVTSSIGLDTSRRVARSVTINPTTTHALPDYRVDGMEKVVRVMLMVADKPKVLPQGTYDDVTDRPNADGPPTSWAVKRMGASFCIVTFDRFSTTDTFTVSFEGYELADILADDAEPAFPQDFHDILIEGAMSDELRKMEKPELAQLAESNYQTRLSDLRMFIAKASYLDIVQGKDKPGQVWYRPWTTRVSMWN